MKKPLLLSLFVLLTSFFLGQENKINGLVIDDLTKFGVPFATVSVKGSEGGTTTDLEGQFYISAKISDTLIIRMVGYEQQEVPISKKSYIEISLKNAILKEVVVVGYGTQESEDVTGSIVQVNSKQIRQTAVAGAADALQGRAAGVEVVNSNGAPGSNTEVRIRGLGSINGSPVLYIVDGLPLDGSAVNAISPQDIESIDILKDASAASIYGARAAGGVILITTKRGKKGKPKVTFDSYYGTQSLIKKMDVMNAEQYANAINIIDVNNGNPPNPTFENPEAYRGLGTDWQDAMFPGGAIYNAHVGVSGGADKSQYAISLDYFNEEGVIPSSFYERYSFRSNLDFDFSKYVKAGTSMNIVRDGGKGVSFNGTLPDNNMLLAAMSLDPTIDPTRPFDILPDTMSLVPTDHYLYDPNDSLAWNNTPRGNTPNPLAQLYRNGRQYGMGWTDKLLTNNYLEIKPFEWLTLKSTIGGDYSINNYWYYNPVFWIDATDKNDIDGLGRGYTRWFSWNWENTISIDKTFNKHTIGVLGGTSAYDWQQYSFNFNKTFLGGTVNNEIPANMLLSSTGAQSFANNEGGDSFWYRRYASVFGRLNYEYDDKYFLTTTVRRDGSSRFGSSYRFGIFPGFSGGWKIHNEQFFKDIEPLSFINFLKLRGGYGQLGNSEAAGDFQYNGRTSINNSRVIFGPDGTIEEIAGSTVDFFPNDSLRWETIGMTNIALDIGFLNNKIWLTAEYYIKNTSDMILNNNTILTSWGVGGAAPVNIGSMQNRGYDINLKYQKLEGEFNYTISTNFSKVTNKIISLSEGLQEIQAGGFGAKENYTITRVGYEVGQFYGLKVDGIFNSQDEVDAQTYTDDNGVIQQAYGPTVGAGDYKYKDMNGDGKINDDDKVVIGSPYPDFTMGLTSNFMYKGFDLSIFMYWSHGNEIFNTAKLFSETSYESTNMSSYMLTDAWSTENPNATIAQLGGDYQNNYFRSSDAYIENGSFLRFKNISLGYTIPSKLSRLAKIDKLRFYVALQNYFTITNYTGRDPELGSTWGLFVQKADLANYTIPKTFNFGINATF